MEIKTRTKTAIDAKLGEEKREVQESRKGKIIERTMKDKQTYFTYTFIL